MSDCSNNLLYTMKAGIAKYDKSKLIDKNIVTIDNETGKIMNFCDTVWKISSNSKPIPGYQGCTEVVFNYQLVEGFMSQAGARIEFGFENWSKENYVLMPAAVYDGNRFEARKIPYSPKLMNPEDIGPDKPIIVTDIPRLNIGEGLSRIQQLAGDLSVPAIGFYSPELKKVFWILTEQKTPYGEIGVSIEESQDRKKAVIAITNPGVREDTIYKICNNSFPSEDKGFDFQKGEELKLKFHIYSFKADRLQVLFESFVKIRKAVVKGGVSRHNLPFSAAWKVQEEKYNRQNWEEEHGYYSVGLREMFLQDWQIGWTGGMISTYPLLFEGNSTSKERVIRTFDFLFPEGIAPSGFFYDCGEHGKWYGGDIRKPHTKNWHLVRKSGDGLYFILKQLMLMEKNRLTDIKEAWRKGTKLVADSFVKMWNNNRQLGQFIDSETGDIIVGGSVSGGIVPGALALAADFFNKQEYLHTAIEIGNYYYENYVKKGLTTGGPGDAIQNPDSESCFGLLNSYVELYEHTGQESWIDKAEEVAKQYITWVVPYDYQFPEDSLFGRLKMQTTGSVYANTQNKHSAPGICTDSGLALLKLFRATGNKLYMDVLQETAHNITQYLSTRERPIGELQPGWMNERVNMSDWNEPVGEIFTGSTWAEISCMLTFIEIPGLYVQPDTGLVCAFDHIEAEVIWQKGENIAVRLTNPTKYNMKVRIFSEKSTEMIKPFGINRLYGIEPLNIGAGESAEIIL